MVADRTYHKSRPLLSMCCHLAPALTSLLRAPLARPRPSSPAAPLLDCPPRALPRSENAPDPATITTWIPESGSRNQEVGSWRATRLAPKLRHPLIRSPSAGDSPRKTSKLQNNFPSQAPPTPLSGALAGTPNARWPLLPHPLIRSPSVVDSPPAKHQNYQTVSRPQARLAGLSGRHARTPACPTTRLVCPCPSARLPVCPLARLPVCPPIRLSVPHPLAIRFPHWIVPRSPP